MPDLSGVTACVFDAYGTLFDVHAAAEALRREIGPKADQLSTTWRTKQLEYTWLRSLIPSYKPFWEVTQDGLDYAMEECGLSDRRELRQKLLNLYFRISVYPEVLEVLSNLKMAGIKTAILSNGSMDMLDGAVESAGVRDMLDAVLSVEKVGVFKPDPRIYQLAMDRFGLTNRGEVAFISANGWDAAAAASFCFQVIWVNRFGKPWDRLDSEPAKILADLTPLPGLVTE